MVARCGVLVTADEPAAIKFQNVLCLLKERIITQHCS